jgi:hypothetical protein
MTKTTTVLIVTIAVLAVASCSKAPEQPAVPAAAPQTGMDTGAAPQAAAPAPVTAPVAPATPTETIADFPDYPGAVQTAFEAKAKVEHGFTKRTSARFSSADPLADVVAFYTKEIPAKGWTVISVQRKPDETKWKLSRAGAEAEIEIEKKVEQATVVKIERDDR